MRGLIYLRNSKQGGGGLVQWRFFVWIALIILHITAKKTSLKIIPSHDCMISDLKELVLHVGLSENNTIPRNEIDIVYKGRGGHKIQV